MALPNLLAGSRRRYFFQLVCNGAAQAISVIAIALMIQYAFDHFVTLGEKPLPSELLTSGSLLFIAVVAAALLRWRERYDAEALGQDYVVEIRRRLFDHMTRLSPRALQTRSRGGTLLRFIGDLTAIRQWVSLGLARLAVASITSVTALVALGLINLRLSLYVTVLLTAAAMTLFILGQSLEQASRNARRRRARLASNISEKVSVLGVVQAFAQRRREQRLIRKQSNELRVAMLQRANRVGQLRAVLELLVGLAGAGIVLLGAWEVTNGHATPGTVIAAMMVVGMLSPGLRDLGRVHEYWRSARVSREKIEGFLKTRGRIRQRRGALDLVIRQGEVELRDVRVLGSLARFSGKAEAGQRVAIIGPNGAGKSTLLALVARLIDPDEGEIRIDGQNIAECSLDSLRSQIGMAGPDFPLLRGSVERNLKYRLPSASAAQLEAIDRYCELGELLKELPAGMRTRLSDGGLNLSAGQRARLVLARAMLGEPGILLLDEADANFDASAARAIERVIADYPGTILMVTHSSEHIERMNQVWRLAGAGKVDEARPDLRLVTRLQHGGEPC